MSLANRLASLEPGSKGLPCPVANLLGQLGEEDRKALLDILDQPAGLPNRISNARLAQALADEGFPIHFKGIERHRTKTCRCFSGS